MKLEFSNGAHVSRGMLEAALDTEQRALLGEHVVQGVAILPGAAGMALALRAVRVSHAGERVVLRDVRFERALLVERTLELRLRARLLGASDGFVIEALESDGAARPHARGCIEHAVAESDAPVAPAFPLAEDALRAAGFGAPRSGRDFYVALHANGNRYGPTFQGVECLWTRGEEAVGKLRAGPATLRACFDLDVAALDAALHVLAAGTSAAGPRPTFVLAEVAEADLPAGAQPAWSCVRLAPALTATDPPAGDVWLFDAAGQPAGRLRGVRLAWLDAPSAAPRVTLTVAATFTAEPLDDVLEFWASELDWPLRVEHAPFNQVFQQLLDPASQLHANHSGVGALLLRLEDWAPAERRGGSAARGRLEAPAGAGTRRLPNGLEVAHLNAYETDYLYQEIFVDRVYARHGVSVQDGDCVFDVGANIGMFSLFARGAARDVSVFAFEPSPRLAPLIAANARLAGGVRVFHCGLSDREGQAPFSFYARSSVFSGYHADALQDEAALRAVIDNMLVRGGLTDPLERQAALEHFLAGRLETEIVECPLRTLSSVIDEYGVERIDLLKIDAEKSEWAILAGIRDEHWPRVRQLVIEVHDRSGSQARRVAALLTERGFDVAFETEELLGGSGLHTLYARRPGASAPRPARDADLAARAARLDAAAASFVDVLADAVAHLRLPLLLVVCPASPEAMQTPELAARLAHWETRLADAARALPGVSVLLPEEIGALYPVSDVHDALALELGHIPYTSSYFIALGSAVVRRLLALRGPSVKVVAVDADETLWNGVAGEAGPRGVDIDAGRAALQDYLIEQTRHGRLLCVCSKNHPDDVLQVFREHPDMRLREEHVSAWRVNWQPKSTNLRDLAAELGLGLDAFVLLDDSPVECAEVAAFAPQVLALPLPRESTAAARFVRHLWLLDAGAVTAEDRSRARLYADDAQRERARREMPDLERFIATLELRCDVQPLRACDVERVAQLTERTNQFNLAKRPRSAAEVRALAERPGMEWLTVRVADRFGDYGLVGVMACVSAPDVLRVDTFLLSCRALGRGVEQRMLAELGRRAEERGLVRLELPYVAAARNQPARAFLEALEPHDRHESTWIIGARAAQEQTARPAEQVETGMATEAPTRQASDRRRDPRCARHIAERLGSVEQIEASLVVRRRRTRIPGGTLPSLRGSGTLRERLGAIWSEVLGLQELALHDDFFEQGGNSLLMVQAASRVGRAFGKPLAFDQAFRLRSVDALARWLEEQGVVAPQPSDGGVTGQIAACAPGAPEGEGSVSQSQQALFYMQQLAPQSWAYNIPFGALCTQALDSAALQRAFERLLARHPVLQTTYGVRRGRIVSMHTPDALADFATVDARAWTPEELQAKLREEAQRAVDLRRGPVARLRLYVLAGSTSALLFVTHHIGVDLWSMEIVVDELLRMYRDEHKGRAVRNEEAPRVFYREFVDWQQRMLEGPEGERQWAYWKRELSGDLPVLKLQFVRRHAGAWRLAGDSHVFSLDEAQADGVRALARREGATLFQVLLAGYAALLFRHTAQEDLVIGAPFAGRDPVRFADVVGDFVNLLPLRIDLAGSPSFRELLRRVAGRVVGALAHQDFPLPLMVQRLRVRSEPGRSPIVQTTFALHEPNRLPGLGAFFLQGNRSGGLSVHGLDLQPAGLTQQEGQFDIALEIVPRENALWGALKYNADLLDAGTAARLAVRYQALLAAATRHPERAVSELTLVGDGPPDTGGA